MNINSLKAVFKWLNNFLYFRPLKNSEASSNFVSGHVGIKQIIKKLYSNKNAFFYFCIIDQLKISESSSKSDSVHLGMKSNRSEVVSAD